MSEAPPDQTLATLENLRCMAAALGMDTGTLYEKALLLSAANRIESLEAENAAQAMRIEDLRGEMFDLDTQLQEAIADD